ncbi:DUF2339 domain-containing protein [Wenzhouxiangella sp. EGI_FJ10409]|uniref:hypothetical protein n=1 Tax=Wenzhouxiangella sp. EGI_FJ10409 TaxID=3243767 RepID=UPI0035E28986
MTQIQHGAEETAPTRLRPFLPHVLAIIAAIALGLVYALAESGGWHFDDSPNLWKLDFVDDWLSAAHFVFSGGAGPTGRPMSLLTFALQAQHYPENPGAFLRINIALHVVNFLLVYTVLSLLGRMAFPGCRRVAWLALTAAGLWAFSPLLMSSTLMAVQRMTLLSATFLLAGLALYLKGRQVAASDPNAGFRLIATGLIAGTVLSSLAKENGALLPTLALCVHYFLLRPAGWKVHPRWHRAHLALLWVPTALILAYLAWIGLVQSGYDHRDFTLWERLLTQSRVLWDYVFSLLLPRTEAATPFSDNFQLSTGLLSPWTTLVAISGWAAAVFLAIALRRWSTVPLFGLCWFLAGHLVESTTPALELYFAHRNYAPSLGLWVLVAWFAFLGLPGNDARKWTRAAAAAYGAMITIVLFSAASLWGQPRLASEIWFIQNEDSIRAAQYIANAHVRENDELVADRIMRTAQEHHTDETQIHLQRLSYCTGSEEDYRTRYRKALDHTRENPEIELGGMAGLDHLAQLAIAGHCPFLHPEDIRKLVEASSPQTGNPRVTRLATRQRLVTQARLEFHDGQDDHAVTLIVQALQTDPNPFLLKSLGTSLLARGLGPKLREHEHELSMVRISKPFGQRLWDRTLAELTNTQPQQRSSSENMGNPGR